MSPEQVIAAYRLVPHPEGGLFREFHRSRLILQSPPGCPGERSAQTAIFYLLTRDTFSAFHRLRAEELWIHLSGNPLELFLLGPRLETRRLASVAEGGPPVAVVPPGVIQAARTLGDFTLTLCIVAPGFDYADFAHPTRETLLREFPEHGNIIRAMTR
jgi:predicted cupin superfamily sugar epimerase